MVFSILRSNGIRNVSDVLAITDYEALGLRDYIVKSLKSFLKQMIMYEGTIDEAREQEKTNRNPQVIQAVDDAFAEESIVKAREEGSVIFSDMVDLISFVQIDSDDEYYSWLEQKGIDDNKEADCLPTTYRLLMEVRQNLFAVNKHNLYIRLLDNVLRHDRFRGVARQYRMENGQDFRPGQGDRYQQQGFRGQQQGFRDQRGGFRNQGNWEQRQQRPDLRANTPFSDFFRDRMADFRGQEFDDHMGHRQDPRQWAESLQDEEPFGERMAPEQPAEEVPTFVALTPFAMVEDDVMQQMARDFYLQHGHYPMLSLLMAYLKMAKTVGTIRMASVIGVTNAADQDDWLKMEARRRYIDGLNRGLGLPDDPGLKELLKSDQWAQYEFDKYDYLTETNYPFKALCETESLDISFNLFAFFVCVLTGKTMVNLQSSKPREDVLVSDGFEGSKFTYVVPAEFQGFLYASFITVTGNRLAEFHGDRERYKEFLLAALSHRFWRGESLEKNRKLFVTIIKDVAADIHGLYADDKTLVDEMGIFDIEPERRQPKPRPLAHDAADGKPRKHYAHREGKLTISDAIVLVLKEHGGPMTQADIVKGVKEKQASDNENSIKVILTTAKKTGKVVALADGTIALGPNA